MTYTLALGDRGYSSWSLRGWLIFDAFGIPVTTRHARMYTDDFPALLADFVPARTVPALKLPDGTVICESLAIAEEIATRHPQAGLWPADPSARAMARSLVAEMHAGFTALRGQCPMNLRVSYASSAMPAATRTSVDADLARLQQLWSMARARFGATGPWLFGDYSLADVFFAPVAARIAGYNLSVGPDAATYVAAHLAHPSFRKWRAMGLVDGDDQPAYARPDPTRAWPGPAALAATIADGPSVNKSCPYSGKPVTDFLRFEGRVWGFCNPFCRDKTIADPEAWPTFIAMTKTA